MPSTPPHPIKTQAPKPRIVQFRNRRYSVRLEPIYWQVLETLAKRQGKRLGQFVADLAEAFTGQNFSSFLRVHCMLETEKELAAHHLDAAHPGLLNVVAACPAPGLVLSRFRTVIGFNDAFAEWLGPVDVALTGAELTSIVQVRTQAPLNAVWQGMVQGEQASADARILYVVPGRVNAAKARILALHSADGEEFYAVMWLTVSGPVATGRLPVAATLAQNRSRG